jgi:hypothetical protein
VAWLSSSLGVLPLRPWRAGNVYEEVFREQLSWAMATQYYYQNAAQKSVGPVGLQELLEARAAGEIRDDLVYPQGQEQWVKFVPSRVTVVDIDMPFLSMVGFMVNWAIATIPAFIVLFAVGFGIVVVSNAILQFFAQR